MDGIETAWQMRREMGRELRARRKAAGWSQEELARRTGKSRSRAKDRRRSARLFAREVTARGDQKLEEHKINLQPFLSRFATNLWIVLLTEWVCF